MHPLLIFFVCIALFGLSACKKTDVPELSNNENFPGGEMTAKFLSDRSYVYPGEGTSKQEQLNFWTGFSLFRDPWVVAPSSTKDRDGLGPLFNTRSCISCHQDGGKLTRVNTQSSELSGLLIRLGPLAPSSPQVDPHYGGQIQTKSIAKYADAMKPEATVSIGYQIKEGEFADGQTYYLNSPTYRLNDLAYGPINEGIGLSPRFAPIVYGAGLLDAISEEDLLAQEDIDDQNNDGISAKYNRVPDITTSKIRLGRFGHKALHPTLKQQVAAAFHGDIGITSSLFTQESCTHVQIECQQLSTNGGHDSYEIPDKLLSLVVQFNQWLAVPRARNLSNQVVQKGRSIFYQIGCESCHTATYRTSESYPVKSLSGQTIWPYTDLALHNMGPELADGVNEYDAKGSEWRTPPLWGLGLQQKFRAEQRFLHDGRASSFSEAILWHGGEAQKSKNQFIQLTRDDRKALLAFLGSI